MKLFFPFTITGSLCLGLLGFLWSATVVTAQDDGEVPPPLQDDPSVGLAGPNGGGAGANFDGGLEDADFAGPVAIDPDRFGFDSADLEDTLGPAFAVPTDALTLIPESARAEVEEIVGRLIPLLAGNDEIAIDEFFTKERDKIAVVFDKIGIKPTADGLLDPGVLSPSAAEGEPAADGDDLANGRVLPNSTIKFPNEFENYDEYLQTLDIAAEDREFLSRSHEIAEGYRNSMLTLKTEDAMQKALDTYRRELRELNEKHSERLRDQFRDSMDRTLDGDRPDIDR